VRDGAGPVQSGQTVHCHIVPSTLDLKVPVLLDGDVNLAFLTKSVRFADAAFPTKALTDYLQDATTILGGRPVPTVDVPLQGPTIDGAIPPASTVNVNVASTTAVLPPRVTSAVPDIALPNMGVPAPSSDNGLSGVPGLLGALAGTIPIPALAPVQLAVTWRIEKVDGSPAPSGSYAQVPGGSASGTDVFFLFFGDLQELTQTGPTPTTFLVIATVTLTVPNATPVTLDLPAIPIVVPGIPIPTLMLLSNATNFGVSNVLDDDMARMVMVPSNSRIASLASLTNALNSMVVPVIQQLSILPTPPWWAPGLLGTLGQLVSLVTSYTPVGDRYPLPVVVADRVPDASAIDYSSGWFDNFDEEDRSVLLLGIPGTKLSLSSEDDLQGNRMDITTGSALFVILNDLGKPTEFVPGTAPPGAPADYTNPTVTNIGGIEDSLEGIGFNQP